MWLNTLKMHLFFHWDRCEKGVMSSVNVRNCICFYQTAEELNATTLMNYCGEIIASHWVSIFRHCVFMDSVCVYRRCFFLNLLLDVQIILPFTYLQFSLVVRRGVKELKLRPHDAVPVADMPPLLEVPGVSHILTVAP